jgi:acetyl-CoA carboxylase carboxyltransferase component
VPRRDEGRPVKVLKSTFDLASEVAESNRIGNLERIAELDRQLRLAIGGGGDVYVSRHRARGRMLARERIELLLDQDAPFLELGAVAAWGTEYAVGASVVTGIGVVSDVECMIVAHDPTVRGGASNPYTWKKVLRAMTVARENRLPTINLVESGGGDLNRQAELFVPAGRLFHELSALSAAGVPTIALVFGNSTAGGAYVPGMCDYTVMVQSQAKVFLGGPPLVKMATGEDADDESLGGADMHARTSGLADYLARDEHECLAIGREIVEHLNWRKLGPGATEAADEPLHSVEDLLAIASVDLKVPFDPKEVIARIVDGSRFEEYKPVYGTALVTGWASIHGFPVGILANARGVLFNEEAKKGAEFILLCNQTDTPLVFLQNTTGFMVGTQYEQNGMIKDGSKMINAVTNSKVPHLTINMAASYGAGNYGMSGRSYDPRLLFTWPNSKTAIMGPEQLAGVMTIVARQAAATAGRAFDEDAETVRRAALEERIEAESLALYMSGQCYDDGVIDPRDTRDTLGLALSMCHTNEIAGTRGFAVFRM